MTDSGEAARLGERLAALEERMNTHRAEYQTDIARLAEDIAKRDTANTRWVVGTVAVAAVFIVAVLGILIRLPPPA